MAKGKKRSRSGKTSSSKRKSVKAYTSRRQLGTRTTAVERNLKFAEKKNFDGDINWLGTTNPSEQAVAGTACLCAVPLGTSANNRVGRRIHCKSLYITARFFAPTNLVGAAAVRMIVFQDKQPNGAVPTVGQLLEADHILSPMNLGNAKRFKILADERLPTLLSVDTTEGVLIERYLKLNFEMGFTNVAGAIDGTAVLTNGIYMIMFLGGFTVTSGVALGTVKTRLRFVDL